MTQVVRFNQLLQAQMREHLALRESSKYHFMVGSDAELFDSKEVDRQLTVRAMLLGLGGCRAAQTCLCG
jgi:hypothetical protein